MKIRVLGAGIYGCHIALSLINEGHTVEVHDIANRIFAGASGGIPARLHTGQHYPRSGLTRAACQKHVKEFMSVYGHLTHCVKTNIYAIAEYDSLVDFDTYCKVLKDEIEYIKIHDPSEFGLKNVEGALLTGERHLVINKAIIYFKEQLKDRLKLDMPGGIPHSNEFDLTIDCTFCANEALNIDRYEPCVTAIMEGPCDIAVTIMDGPFGSLYAWDEDLDLSSLTSAKYTPFSKTCKTWAGAKNLLNSQSLNDINDRSALMIEQMRNYYPAIDEYRHIDNKLSIRAMPRSGSDARLVSVDVKDKVVTIRAGKIDAILDAEKAVKGIISDCCDGNGIDDNKRAVGIR